MAYVSTSNMQRKKSGKLKTKKSNGPGLTKLSKGYGKSKNLEDRRFDTNKPATYVKKMAKLKPRSGSW